MYDFASGNLIHVKDDVREEDIYSYMNANRYSIMYIYFNYENKSNGISKG